jgi:hypothetical protein
MDEDYSGWHAYHVREGYTFVPTNEDFFPSFDAPIDEDGFAMPGGFVACGILPQINISDVNGPPIGYKVVVTGEDDSSYYREDLSHDEARSIMCRLPVIMNRRWLVDNVFDGW